MDCTIDGYYVGYFSPLLRNMIHNKLLHLLILSFVIIEARNFHIVDNEGDYWRFFCPTCLV